MLCPICEVSEAQPCLIGCEHAFCFQCIVRWTTTRRATCPNCRAPVYGILHDDPGSVFLHPHDEFVGLRLMSQRGRTVVLDVTPGSLAESLGLRHGDVISSGRAREMEEVSGLITASRADKTLCLLHVSEHRSCCLPVRRKKHKTPKLTA